MKKTLIVTIDFPPAIGGVSAYWKRVCASLKVSDFSVLAQKHSRSSDFDQYQAYKITRKQLFFKLIWPRWVKGIYQIYRVYKQTESEQILAAQLLPVGSMAYILHKLLGIPYVVQIYGMDIKQAAVHPRKKRLARKVLLNAKDVIVNSEAIGQALQAFMQSDISFKVVYPIPELGRAISEQAIAEFRQKYQLSTKPMILSAGRLVKRKGFDQVIHAMKDVWQKFPDAQLMIIGEGQYQDDLKSMTDDQRVHFLGRVSDEDRDKAMAACDIFIMASREMKDDIEGFGMVFLEAMAYEKPVIAGRSGGSSEAVLDQKTGLVVNADDSSQISSAIVRLLSEPHFAQELAQAGKSRLLNEFDWEEIIKRLESAL